MGSVNQETGEKNKDGVGVLFNGIINRDDDSLAELIVLASSKFVTKGATEEDAIKAIENWIDEHDADSTEGLFEEIQQEMVDSGFFKEDFQIYREFGNSSGIYERAGQRQRVANSGNRKNDWQYAERTLLINCARMGLTDLETIYSCNKWQLDAIMEGLHYRQIDMRENLSELAMELRYTLNAKRVSSSKLSKNKDRNKVKQAFSGNYKKENEGDLASRLQRLNDHFANR